MSARLAIRLGAAVVSAVVAVGAFVPPGVVASPSAVGRVSLDDGATATRFATATVTVVPPSGPASLLRVSNDGGSTWVERSYATSFTWSLVDPAAGGTEVDGQKTVTVEAGDGVGPWASLGADAILLDRTPPSVGGESAVPRGWRMTSEAPVGDTGAGLLRAELSLDGVHWRTLLPRPRASDAHPAGYFDFREGVIGGSWATGERHYFLRGIDRVGNVSETRDFSVVVEAAWDVDDIPGLVMTYPLPAITGHPFTVNPVWDSSYRVPAGYVCRWSLVWQSEATYFGGPKDEDYGRVSLSRAPKNGRCEAWTFTLPYAPSLLYHVGLSLMGAGDLGVGRTPPGAGTFRAARDGTDRGIADSNLPLYYIVPNRGLVPAGGSVTYHLESAGTSTLPNTGDLGLPAVPGAAGDVLPANAATAARRSPAPSTVRAPGWPSGRGGPRRPGTSAPSTTRSAIARSPPWARRSSASGPLRRRARPTRPCRSRGAAGTRDRGSRATRCSAASTAAPILAFRSRAPGRRASTCAWPPAGPTASGCVRVIGPATGAAGPTAPPCEPSCTRRAQAPSPGRAAGPAGSPRAPRAARSATQRWPAAAPPSASAAGAWAGSPARDPATASPRSASTASSSPRSTSSPPPHSRRGSSGARRGRRPRAHVVQVRLLGTAGRPRVEVDAFEVLR